MPSMKGLDLIVLKLWPTLKLGTNRQTDGQTDRAEIIIMPSNHIAGGIKTTYIDRI